VLVAALARQPRTVRVGDHWHATSCGIFPRTATRSASSSVR